MSIKEDKKIYTNNQIMRIAINLAKINQGLTGPNPSVGCVITKNNQIISYGITSYNGRPHAEQIAINKLKKKDLKNSNIFITMEPCTHYGKTPPCTKKILKSNFNKVYFSSLDVDVRTMNKAKKIFKKNKIPYVSGLMKKDSQNLYKAYYSFKKKNSPYVIGKIAFSRNKKIFNNRTHITNYHSRNVSHLLRYRNQAILTSYKTINSDNPLLTCRINGLEEFSPIKIILDSDLNTKINSNIFNKKKFKTYIFHNSLNKKKIDLFKKKGAVLKKVSKKNNNLDLSNIMFKLKKMNISSVLVESGPKLLNNLLDENLINEFYLFKSNKNISAISGINISKTLNKIINKFKQKKVIHTFLDKDKLVKYF